MKRSRIRTLPTPNSPRRRESLDAVVDRLVVQAGQMTKAERRQSLIRAGIISPNGQLTAPYR